jgi:quercetin 2,3-dioxygenase
MLKVRRDSEIHDVQGGWFRARWHFSFDDYRDPENDSFGAMRVFNDDRLVPGAVWPLHPHRDVEGLTYVVEGSFGHEDNVGGPFGPLPAGSVQRMTLGSGAWHSELNASKTEPMRFIQIWILPDTPSLPPGVEQRVFTKEDRTNRLLRAFAPIAEAGEGSGEAGGPVGVHQDASVYLASLDSGIDVNHAIGEGRGVYLYVIDGRVSLSAGSSKDELSTADAAKASDEPSIDIHAADASELILVDVPMRFETVGIWAGRT